MPCLTIHVKINCMIILDEALDVRTIDSSKIDMASK